MKHRLLLLVAAAALLPLYLNAQPRAQISDEEYAALIHENLYRTGVNTNPYEFLPQAETPVPAGYKPFYISHYGRHGARSNWSGNDYADIVGKLEAAARAGVLTPMGETVLAHAREVSRQHNGMNGRLTYRGTREHRQIAGRMFQKYKKVFTKGKRMVRAVSSVSPRCIVSMNAFTGELLSRDPSLDLRWDTGEKIMLYCSTNDPKDVKEAAMKLVNEHLLSQLPDTATFLNRLFTDVPKGLEAVGCHAVQLMSETIDIAVICGSYDLDDTVLRLFNEADLVHYARNISLNLYLRQCNSLPFGDRRMENVEPLVDDVIAKADEAIATGAVAADLRFGHDYQLLAFSSRIGIRGIGERMTAEEALAWPGFLYSPFAGNLQMVFYKNRKGDVLVKFFSNERETSLLSLPGGPYYRWEDVKTAWKQ